MAVLLLGEVTGGVLNRDATAKAVGAVAALGEVAGPEDAQQMCAALRARVAALHGDDVAAGLRILYGGSVKSSSAPALLAQPDVDGALVGGASLDADEFAKIVRFDQA